jgi:hypothetical protein
MMGFYRPCHNCKLERLPCARRDGIAAQIRGLGLTGVKFRCKERQPLFTVGERVNVTWLVPTGDSWDGYHEDRTSESWPATVVAERRPKFQILVDDVDSDYDTPARDYIKNESLYAKVTAAKLTALDEPARNVCAVCQAVQIADGSIAGCYGYDKEAGGGYGYTPQGCLKATLPFRDTDGSPQGPDRNGLDGEAATAGAEGIADTPHA